MQHTNHLNEALDFINKISKSDYAKNKSDINKKIFNYLYFLPKFQHQTLFVDKIVSHTDINNQEIYLLIRDSWNTIPNLYKDKFYYFISLVVKEVSFKEFFLADLEIKNYVLRMNVYEKDLIYEDILVCRQISTMEIYKESLWFEEDFLREQVGRSELREMNRRVMYEMLNKGKQKGV
ncbi:hypothetical protein CDIK_0903 [Cucumispora dikerogammari]|nr:hypothetical protein CDIK_0903 [Cucumispora dikerogammari]